MSVLYPPHIKVQRSGEEILIGDGYQKLKKQKVLIQYPDEKLTSEEFTAEYVAKNDAVAILAHFEKQGKRYVYLRSCLRLGLMLRDYTPTQLLEPEDVGNIYEIPAGAVELDEIGISGLQEAAQRELMEEVGFDITLMSKFKLLGKRVFTSVATTSERIFFFEVEVNPWTRVEPTLDGSPLEKGGIVQCIPVTEAIDLVRQGYLADAKTEIGLMRLAHRYPDRKLED